MFHHSLDRDRTRAGVEGGEEDDYDDSDDYGTHNMFNNAEVIVS